MTAREHRGRTARGRGEDGFTLVEQLVAMSLLGIGVVAILGAVLTVVSTSARHRDLSDAAALVATAGQRLTSWETGYEPCPGPGAASAYTAAAQPRAASDAPVQPGTDIAVTAVAVWDGSSFLSCADPLAPTTGAQRLTVRVRTGVAEETMEVVKWG